MGGGSQGEGEGGGGGGGMDGGGGGGWGGGRRAKSVGVGWGVVRVSVNLPRCWGGVGMGEIGVDGRVMCGGAGRKTRRRGIDGWRVRE